MVIPFGANTDCKRGTLCFVRSIPDIENSTGLQRNPTASAVWRHQKYDINQEAGNTKGATYDKTIYKAEVFVIEDDNGVLSAETIVYTRDSNNKSASCKFVNTFPEGDNPEGTSGGSSSGSSDGMTATQKGDSTLTGRIKTGVETDEFVYACAGLAGMLVAAWAVRKKRKNNNKGFSCRQGKY